MKSKADELRRELAHAVNEHNLLLGKMDAEVQRALWAAAQSAAGSAFACQIQADTIRATGAHVPLGALSKREHKIIAEAEATCREAMADAMRELSHEIMRMTDTVPSFAQEAGIKLS